MADVLFVSKPVAPPWNDSSKNLARDLAAHLTRRTPTVMGHAGQASPFANATLLEVYRGRTVSFAPTLWDHLRVLRCLTTQSTPSIWHFFFAPNPRASGAARFASRLKGKSTIHTVCSLPRDARSLRRLAFADVTVALSRYSYERFAEAGLREDALRLIPPTVPALPIPSPARRLELRERHGLPADAQIWIYPGDLELGGGAQVTVEAFAAQPDRDALLLMACRDKTPSAASARAALRTTAKRLGLDGRIRWIGETPAIHELLGCSDFVLLPNSDPYAKMDYPLAALEAMMLGRPVVVAKGTPAAELADDDGAVSVEPEPEAVSQAVERLSMDDARRAELTRRARRLALERFDPKTVASEYERVYDAL